jgi:hypothetical protein
MNLIALAMAITTASTLFPPSIGCPIKIFAFGQRLAFPPTQ